MNLYRTARSLMRRELKVPQAPLKRVLSKLGYFRLRTRLAAEGASVPNIELYEPLFSPWSGLPAFRKYYDPVRAHTLVSADRCWILASCMTHAREIAGDFAEFGVFRGGTALLAAQILADAGDRRPLHLFDSFAGMPTTSDGEPYNAGDFRPGSAEDVRRLVGTAGANVRLHVGYIPDTFVDTGIEQLAFAHIDVDLWNSVHECIEFVYPRVVAGGLIVFDDYGFPSCARARQAVDQAFERRRETPIYLPTGQAVVIKLP